MKRDFTEAAKKELLALVDEVNEEQWFEATDWLGDRAYDVGAWLGRLNVESYVDNISKYHKKVIDKNDATKGDINTIFDNVNTVSTNYKSRFTAVLADIQSYIDIINVLSNTVSPSNGIFNSEYIGKGLKDAINTYIETSENLQKISGDGLTQEEVKNMDQDKLQKLLDSYASVILDNVPNAKIGDEFEIPIGPGVSIYYKVSGKVNGTGNADLNFVIDKQKAELKEFEYSINVANAEIGSGVDKNGDISIKSKNSYGTGVDISGEGVKFSQTNEHGNSTYTYVIKTTATYPPVFSVEETVTTKVDGGSVSSTVGIKYTGENNGWKPIPVYVPVESPYPCRLPDIKWEEVVGTLMVIAGVVYVVKKVAGVILLVPTGGASAVLVVT